MTLLDYGIIAGLGAAALLAYHLLAHKTVPVVAQVAAPMVPPVTVAHLQVAVAQITDKINTAAKVDDIHKAMIEVGKRVEDLHAKFDADKKSDPKAA